jgi:hypothetical protein
MKMDMIELISVISLIVLGSNMRKKHLQRLGQRGNHLRVFMLFDSILSVDVLQSVPGIAVIHYGQYSTPFAKSSQRVSSHHPDINVVPNSNIPHTKSAFHGAIHLDAPSFCPSRYLISTILLRA